jgi:hypothetical protein
MYTYRELFITKGIPKLRSAGFIVAKVFHNGNYIGLHRKGEKLDVDIVQKDGKCIAGLTKNAKYTTDCNDILKYLGNLRKIQFLGTTFNVPSDEYLEFLYGSTWKIPLKSK